jgi:hypothetical protein
MRDGVRVLVAAAASVAVWLAQADAMASVGPLLTEEAYTVDAGKVRLTTWAEIDSEAAQDSTFAVAGIADRADVAVGAMIGAGYGGEKSGFGVAGPVAQVKLALLRAKRGGPPGLSLIAGGRAPWGRGGFEAEGWVGYGFAALTLDVWGHRLAFTADAGAATARESGRRQLHPVGGAGASVAVAGSLRTVAEVFHGDPFAERRGGLVLAGLRYVIGDDAGIDALVGAGVWGSRREPIWGPVGFRIDGKVL